MRTELCKFSLSGLAVLALCASLSAQDAAFEFALLGDNPYVPEAVPKFATLIDDVNSQSQLEWVVHVGDIKGGEPCSDEILKGRFDLYQRFAAPFVYTPGDNEWFDCSDDRMGNFDEYERLGYLRALFFPSPGRTTGRRTMEVRAQSAEGGFDEFVENVLWTKAGVVFSTVHMIGLTRPPKDPAIAERRMDAALSWVEKTFAVAREIDAAAVFMATQADPWVVSGNRGVIGRLCPDCLRPRPGLERLYPLLIKESNDFSGPVVFAVGDTHVFRVDKPLYAPGLELVSNFTRVEPFGHPDVHWLRVTVDPSTPQVFSLHQQVVAGNVP